MARGVRVTLSVAMMTCEREPNYAPASIESVFAGAPELARLEVVVDGHDASYLGEIGHDARVSLHVLGPGEQREAHHHSRVAATFHRALRTRRTGADHVVIQDDVEASPGWLRDAQAAATAVGAELKVPGLRCPPLFLVQLFCGWPLRQCPVQRLSPKQFFGCVANLYPAPFAAGLDDFIAGQGYAEHPDDWLVLKFVLEGYHEVYAANPSVVQHVGSEGTTHDAKPCVSPSYVVARSSSL